MSDAIGVVNKAGLALLKSNAEKGVECSAGETLKLIEALEIGHKNIFDLHDQLAVARLTLKQSQDEVVRLKVALEEIFKPTYGTELINSDEENNAILAPHIFRLQGIARKALYGH